MNSRKYLLNGTALVAAVAITSGFGTAYAQSDPAADGDVPGGEIIVTAQRRTEALVDVPASVVVQTGESLRAAGITSTRDLTQVVPGLNFVASGTYQTPSLRGVTVAGSAPGVESPVAIYIDGVYQPTQAGALFDLPDIAQIEVLKGPQGTLYGRNATGGAILIKTIDPGDEIDARVRFSFGRFEDLDASATMSGPITEGIGFSISAAHHQLQGYNKNINTGKDSGKFDSSLIRGKLVLEPVEAVKLTLTGYYSKRYDESTFSSTTINANTSAHLAGVVIATKPNTTSVDFPSFMRNRAKGASVRADIDLGFGSLMSISSYNRVDTLIQTDADYTAAPSPRVHYIIDQHERAYAQDLILTSNPIGPLEFILGGSYFDGNGYYDPFVIIGVTNIYAATKSKAKAVFGEVTLNLTDQLSITGGLRYNSEKRSISGARNVRDFPFLGGKTFSDLIPSAVIKYEMPDIGNVYASYKQGFKSGDFATTSLNPVPTRPEQIAAYEVGFKSRRLGAFQFNAAAFYYDYTDIIVSVYQLAGQAVLTNAAAATMKGFDFEATYRPIPDLTLAGSFTYLDAKYDKFAGAQVNVPIPAATCTATGKIYPCGNALSNAGDLSGNRLPRAPKYTINLNADYRFDVGTAGEGRVHLNGYRNGGFVWEPGNRIKQKAYTVVNGTLSFSPADTPLTLSLWGRNLTNEHYTQGANIVGTADTWNYASPRTYGVAIEANF
ncbi:MAG TPA: TonB-dependent receptor [Novosphingobium sp.]|nr:TonB-dependent receptor [Novosphingobium sp.]